MTAKLYIDIYPAINKVVVKINMYKLFIRRNNDIFWQPVFPQQTETV